MKALPSPFKTNTEKYFVKEVADGRFHILPRASMAHDSADPDRGVLEERDGNLTGRTVAVEDEMEISERAWPNKERCAEFTLDELKRENLRDRFGFDDAQIDRLHAFVLGERGEMPRSGMGNGTERTGGAVGRPHGQAWRTAGIDSSFGRDRALSLDEARRDMQGNYRRLGTRHDSYRELVAVVRYRSPSYTVVVGDGWQRRSRVLLPHVSQCQEIGAHLMSTVYVCSKLPNDFLAQVYAPERYLEEGLHGVSERTRMVATGRSVVIRGVGYPINPASDFLASAARRI